MASAISSISFSRMPRVVTIGVPSLMPLAMAGGFSSNGIAFLLTVMPASSSAASASLPVIPFVVTSTSIRWVSVPPDTIRRPRFWRPVARALAFATTCCWYFLKPGESASFRATALAALTCINGPPWRPGKTALASALRSEEHTSELQSPCNLVCRLLLEKKNQHRLRVRQGRLSGRRHLLCHQTCGGRAQRVDPGRGALYRHRRHNRDPVVGQHRSVIRLA